MRLQHLFRLRFESRPAVGGWSCGFDRRVAARLVEIAVVVTPPAPVSLSLARVAGIIGGCGWRSLLLGALLMAMTVAILTRTTVF
jgi:hypothetical protein